MDPQFSKKNFNGKRYVDLLWDDFRNGLAHGFTIKQGGFEHCAIYFQEKPIDGFKQLEIDPTNFFEDFKQAISKYLNRLRASSLTDTVRKNFNKAFSDLYIWPITVSRSALLRPGAGSRFYASAQVAQKGLSLFPARLVNFAASGNDQRNASLPVDKTSVRQKYGPLRGYLRLKMSKLQWRASCPPPLGSTPVSQMCGYL